MPDQPPRQNTANNPSDFPEELTGKDFEGRYRIETRLGSGGVGDVYRAIDLKLSRPVALKVLQADMASSGNVRARFEREARALAKLTHPNVVSILDFGVAEKRPYLVMELLEGYTLTDLLENEAPLKQERAFDILRQVLQGLKFVHQNGLIHRDLKPSNVFLQPVSSFTDHVKLLDFGLAKFLDTGTLAESPTLTLPGQVYGTPGYIAPEQVVGGNTDKRADIYAVGVILYEMLAGRKPFLGESLELIRHQLTDPVPRISQTCPGREVVPELDLLLQRALSREPDDRYRDTIALSLALDSLPKLSVIDRFFTVSASDPVMAPPEPRSMGWTVKKRLREAYLDTREVLERSLQPLFQRRALQRRHVVATLSALVLVGAATLVYRLSCSGPSESAVLPDEHLVAEPVAITDKGASKKSKKARAIGQSSDSSAAASDGKKMERPPPANPWARSVPKNLAKVRKAVKAKTRLDDRTVAFLRNYNRNRPQDPRGHLLLAGLYMNRNWLRDAVKQYDLAYHIDPGCRGDRVMLRDLLKLVKVESTTEQASRLIRQAYGKEALAPLKRAIDREKDNSVDQKRLIGLREAINR